MPLSDFCWKFVSLILSFCSEDGLICLPGPELPPDGLFGLTTVVCFWIKASCFLSLGAAPKHSADCCFRTGMFWLSSDGFLPLPRFSLNSPLFRGSETKSPIRTIYFYLVGNSNKEPNSKGIFERIWTQILLTSIIIHAIKELHRSQTTNGK